MRSLEGSFTKACSNCGFQSPDEKRYCGNCGASLADAVAPRVIVVEAQQLPARFRPTWMWRETARYLAPRGVAAAILILIGVAILLSNPQHCETIRLRYHYVYQSIEVCEPAVEQILLAFFLLCWGVAIGAYATFRAAFA